MKNLKIILFENNISQRELAKAAGCSEAYISRCMKGRDNMSPVVKNKIAEFLNIPVSEVS